MEPPTYAEYRPLAVLAHKAVQRAVRRGDLPRLLESDVACVDCGKRALQWEHRDYTKQLEVEPVCIRCNNARGPAFPYDQPGTKTLIDIKREMGYPIRRKWGIRGLEDKFA